MNRRDKIPPTLLLPMIGIDIAIQFVQWVFWTKTRAAVVIATALLFFISTFSLVRGLLIPDKDCCWDRVTVPAEPHSQTADDLAGCVYYFEAFKKEPNRAFTSMPNAHHVYVFGMSIILVGTLFLSALGIGLLEE